MSNSKLLRATHEGKLTIGELEIPCAVLADGTRLLTQGGFLKAIGRSRTPKAGTGGGVAEIPFFISASNLKPFIDKELLLSTTPILFTTNKGVKAWGYRADLLPRVCEVYLKAKDEDAILASQQQIVRHCEILVRGLAHIGIISLVDEATGYQYTREKDELQKILKAYIAEELLPWQKTFPDIYYREIFRLNGWDFTVPSIKKRPGVVGTWTNKIVYEQLPKGVLKELKDNTPKSPSGNYTARFFQSLTPDVGNSHLQNQLNSVITLMQVSDNWKSFIIQFNKLVDRRKGQLELKFEDFEEKPQTKKIENPTSFDKTLKGLLSVPPPPKDKKSK
ncbi:MAG TPA: P63C domain-containing protein [Puia sp.]|nr:P63C domain-containing protein [Puia sp.]